jgi:lipopolysaccharide/colanic/teichoic acid biosynthesis glycosyltransferase
MQSHTSWSNSAQGLLTRLLDISLSLAALIALSPLMLVLAVAVRCSSPGPVLYRARRVGKNGRLFQVYKFRSMVTDTADSGPRVTGSGDPRVTKLGRILRRTKLDELPQLLNTLIGDMSLVGPRPEDPCYVQSYSAEQRQVLRVKPGITSPATLLHRHEEELLSGRDFEETYRREILPNKLRIELEYLSRRTLSGDVRILMQTAFALFRRPTRLGANRGPQCLS